jgi:hypothetical protein
MEWDAMVKCRCTAQDENSPTVCFLSSSQSPIIQVIPPLALLALSSSLSSDCSSAASSAVRWRLPPSPPSVRHTAVRTRAMHARGSMADRAALVSTRVPVENCRHTYVLARLTSHCAERARALPYDPATGHSAQSDTRPEAFQLGRGAAGRVGATADSGGRATFAAG